MWRVCLREVTRRSLELSFSTMLRRYWKDLEEVNKQISAWTQWTSTPGECTGTVCLSAEGFCWSSVNLVLPTFGTAIVKLIPKEEECDSPKKSRPIALTNTHGKVFMAIVADRVSKYMDQNNVDQLWSRKGICSRCFRLLGSQSNNDWGTRRCSEEWATNLAGS